MAVVGENAYVRVFDLLPEPREIVLEHGGDNMDYFSVALSMSGRWLAVEAQNTTIRVWDLETKKRIASPPGNSQSGWSLSFSPDDRTLASSRHGGVTLWHVPTWQELMRIDHDCFRVQFSPDSRYLAAMGGAAMGFAVPTAAGLRIWQAPTLAEIDASSTGQTVRNPVP